MSPVFQRNAIRRFPRRGSAAFEGRVDPEAEPEVFRLRLAEAVGAPNFDTLKHDLTDLRARARAAFEQAVPAARDG